MGHLLMDEGGFNPIKCLVLFKNLNLIGYTLSDEWAQIKNSLGATSD